MKPEENPGAFLAKIVNTIAVVALCMIVNIFIGLYLNYAFFETSPDWKNYTYYAFLLASAVFLFIYIRRKWKL